MHRTATLQTRGRVTLPRKVRQALHVAPGDEVTFFETAPGRFEVRAEARTAALLNRPRPVKREVAIGASAAREHHTERDVAHGS